MCIVKSKWKFFLFGKNGEQKLNPKNQVMSYMTPRKKSLVTLLKRPGGAIYDTICNPHR